MIHDGVIPRLRDDEDMVPGFTQITPLDPAGRRALWIKFGQPAGHSGLYACDGSFVELRSGREGDDSHVVLHAGEVLTAEKITEIVDCLLRASDALGMT